MCCQTLFAPFIVERIEKPFNTRIVEVDTGMISCRRFEMMRFINDEIVVIRQDTGRCVAIFADCEIAKKEVMVYDEQVGVVHLSSDFEVEASIVGFTVASETVVPVRSNLIPHLRVRLPR